jgi:exosortase
MDRQTGNGILEEFRIEFLECWQRLPNKGLFMGLFVAWLALFQFLGNSTLGYVPTHSLMYWMYKAYNPTTPETETEADHGAESGDAHGNLVPVVVLALLWWKRKELLAADLRSWAPGLVLVAAGLFFHVLGYAVQQPRISIVGLFTGLYGLTGMAWGPGWLRRSFFPYCLFVFSVPLGSLAEPLTFKLRLLVSRLVELIAHYFLAIDITRSGTKLIDPTGRYEYEVAAACSGIRSLIATIALGVVLGFVSFRQWWKRLAMIVSALPLAVLGNLLRMLTIVIAAELGGRQWGKVVHDGGPAGIFSLLPYVPAFVGLLALEHYLRGGKRAAPDATGGKRA